MNNSLKERENNYIQRISNIIKDNSQKLTIPRIGRFLVSNVNSFIYKGVKVTEKKWDYLVILDACRYDFFKKYNTLPGKLRKKWSVGSCTTEWFLNTFTEEKYQEIVYVSGNGFISKVILDREIEIDKKKFPKLISRFKSEIGHNPFFHLEEVCLDGWNEELKTVPPKVITQRALRVIQKFPGKRMIIHYMQPHRPFIDSNLISQKGNGNSTREEVLQAKGRRNIFHALKKGKVKLEETKKAYAKNLILVLKEVKKLIRKLEGRIILTSDHGNCFGEYGLYGHPWGVKIRPLREIPWLIINTPKKNSLRKRIRGTIKQLKQRSFTKKH